MSVSALRRENAQPGHPEEQYLDLLRRILETGVDHGVLYIPDEAGNYDNAFPWNGLTTVTESPSGAEHNPHYADNIKYLNLISAEEFGATIEAFTYPEEFSECDGTAIPSPGIAVGQQGRKVFGLCYRTRLGNDLLGTDYGYKLHLIYGAQAAPSTPQELRDAVGKDVARSTDTAERAGLQQK